MWPGATNNYDNSTYNDINYCGRLVTVAKYWREEPKGRQMVCLHAILSKLNGNRGRRSLTVVYWANTSITIDHRGVQVSKYGVLFSTIRLKNKENNRKSKKEGTYSWI